MKTIHIVIIVVIIVALGGVITLFTGSDTYSDFAEASKYPGREFHIIGKLDTAKGIAYNSAENPNQFFFYMVDNKGIEKKVLYRDAKPQDFEKSEQVVTVGKMEGDLFVASSLLLKCPSKYNSQQRPEGFGNKTFEPVKK